MTWDLEYWLKDPDVWRDLEVQMADMSNIGHDGWIPCATLPPPSGILLRFWNEYTGDKWSGYWESVVIQPGDCLWWKLTGIARNQR